MSDIDFVIKENLFGSNEFIIKLRKFGKELEFIFYLYTNICTVYSVHKYIIFFLHTYVNYIK